MGVDISARLFGSSPCFWITSIEIQRICRNPCKVSNMRTIPQSSSTDRVSPADAGLMTAMFDVGK